MSRPVNFNPGPGSYFFENFGASESTMKSQNSKNSSLVEKGKNALRPISDINGMDHIKNQHKK